MDEKPALIRNEKAGFDFTRVVWLGLILLGTAIFAISVPARYHELKVIAPEGQHSAFMLSPWLVNRMSLRPVLQLTRSEANELKRFGLTLRAYAAYQVALEVIFFLIALLAGVIIAWRKAIDRIGIITSLALFSAGFTFSSTVLALGTNRSTWSTLGLGLFAFGIVSNILLWLVFPSGKFYPPWARWVAPPLLGWTLILLFSPNLIRERIRLPFLFIDFVLIAIFIIYAQVTRYRNLSTRLERQQTKWIIYGLLVAFLLRDIFGFWVEMHFSAESIPSATHLGYNLIMPPLYFTVSAFPLFAIGFSILRYRLWEIDFIIRKTLIYSILTSILTLLFFGLVLSLQGVFRLLTGQSRSELGTVVSTLAIVVLFTPLRRRIQDGIDRRFYRHRYNLEQTLAEFSAELRHEVDINKISDRLVEMIQETMQPESVSLWLNRSKERTHTSNH